MTLDPRELPCIDSKQVPSAAALSAWLQNAGMWARAARLRWRQLMRLHDAGPVVLLFTDGGAGLLVGANAEQNIVVLKDPRAAAGGRTIAVDKLRLEQVWSGEAILLRAARGQPEAEKPFGLSWLAGLVLQEKRSLRDVGLASLTLSFLTIFPPLLVMSVVDKVLTHNSYSTLALLAVLLATAAVFEVLLGYARRLIVLVVGTRLDAKLNLHVFNRVLRLPLDYFERHPAGETMHKIVQVYKIREFLTGKLLSTFLDLTTLVVLLPFLFLLNAILAWMVLACAASIMLVILSFLKPLRQVFAKVVRAETDKASALGETIFGIKTIKSLALERQRSALWDARVADAARWRLAFGKLTNWPQTIVAPIERFMSIGIVLVGAYMALADNSGYAVGALFAFMMLSMRVAQPLAGLARLIEDYQSIAAAIGEAASVLNRPPESEPAFGGLLPRFAGAISFEDVSFTYEGTTIPALDRVTFEVPPGIRLGIVGRSGSGKSTLTRLLQGINRDYTGFLKIDGNDVRDINLRHLRQNFGVVLQENFLFRGSIRDNIIAGRPGLTLDDAVLAARLAGAEEFIERMPNGYETLIEEGSPNVSGGQRQRLAIARALISDPRILVLDEATSALDPESEALLNANLIRIAHGRTMVIVSHRLSSLIDCDQILVLERGRAVDIAPHRVLLERCTIYRQLWMQQNRHLEDQGLRHAALAHAPFRCNSSHEPIG
ncbi:peptidase domain-containing ABC transporter [Bradyrhizobium sp. STM 3557]|uniref:peptidase domain-containing ABC transporter n=1 Tax=Bradyrhizobium sp. STM 3557 TaxID=578920 RepID=UPI003890B014